MSNARDNHYVPEWYQKGFLSNEINQLHYLDLNPDKLRLDDGRVITMNSRSIRSTSRCFYQTDLYTTFFGPHINDEIERRLFGKIDDSGARAIWAFISDDISKWHQHFTNFFSYLDSQKLRTPKGLDWISSQYPDLKQLELMLEMQAIRHLHCTIWTEGVREIVSAGNSPVKFLLIDHPVTIYNYACPPDSEFCDYPNDPTIDLKGTQTIFPLDMNNCLILTNFEYANRPDEEDPVAQRTNPRLFRKSLVRTDQFIRTRVLGDKEVETINFILKSRARRYIASSNEEWLFPEMHVENVWSEFRSVLLPPKNEVLHFGGEIYAGFDNGKTYYQDAFGRTTPESKHLEKNSSIEKIGRNDPCGCGSGKKFKKCCLHKREEKRPAWNVLSIRERNLALFDGVTDILGLSKGKTWDDVRRELSNDQVKMIHELYGYLWPIDTDIFSLLPKPDGELRGLYTGIIDPRVISQFALSFTPYIDEIIIQHPFINPAGVKPEFSPTQSPHQYKQQTLKNILLLFTLIPFIDAGFVNFIPDPCFFDQHLHMQMLHMAKERSGDPKIVEAEEKLFIDLQKEDFQRTIRALPKEYQIRQISRALPDLTPEKIEEVLQYMEKMSEEDPFSLLQEDLIGEKGGQLAMMSMAPNFELSLFIAQVTGSILLTDSPYRWSEIENAQHKEAGVIRYPWNDLTTLISDLDYQLNANPEISFRQRSNNHFVKIRKTFREIVSTASSHKTEPDIKLIERLRNDFLTAYGELRKHQGDLTQLSFEGKISCLIPEGGFVHNNVQRLLLTTGSKTHVNCVPVAIFLEPQTKS